MTTREQLDDVAATVRGHMPVLDGWRGIAILVIVIHNTSAGLDGDGSPLLDVLADVFDAGWVGVSLFFVLSGFLISGILIDTRDAPHVVRDFFVRRTLRIFPLYYGICFVAFVVAPIFADPGTYTEGVEANQLWFWLYLSNWTPLLDGNIPGMGHFWSLAVEEQVYLLWPALILLTPRRHLAPTMAVIAIAGLIARIVWWRAGLETDHLYSFTFARVDEFAIGGFLAAVAREPARLAPVLRTRRLVLGAAVVGFVAVVVWASGFNQWEVSVLLYGQTAIAVGFGWLLLTTISPQTRSERSLVSWIDRPPLRALGKYSYAIYILHFPLEEAIDGPVLDRYVNSGPILARIGALVAWNATILAASLLLAYITWHLWEKHFLALKDRFAPRPSSSRSPSRHD